jgi:hypothetical protein
VIECGISSRKTVLFAWKRIAVSSLPVDFAIVENGSFGNGGEDYTTSRLLACNIALRLATRKLGL